MHRHAAKLGVEYVAFLHKAHWLNAAKRGSLVETVWCPAQCYLLLWRPDFKNQGSPTIDCNWYVFTCGSMKARSWGPRWDAGRIRATILALLDRAGAAKAAKRRGNFPYVSKARGGLSKNLLRKPQKR